MRVSKRKWGQSYNSVPSSLSNCVFISMLVLQHCFGSSASKGCPTSTELQETSRDIMNCGRDKSSCSNQMKIQAIL